MHAFTSAADVRAQVGQHLGYSDWHMVDQERVDRFAAATGDHQWIHVDPVRARSGPYGTTIVHGFLTLALAPILVQEIWQVPGARMRVNYGVNKVRFPAPLPTGSKVRAGSEIIEVIDVAGGIDVVNRVTIVSADADKPCCMAETVTRYYF